MKAKPARKEPTSADGTPRPKPPKFTVTLSDKKCDLSIDRAFSLTHQLVTRGHFDSAALVPEWLEGALPNDRRVKVLHARSEARQANYAECRQRLNEVLLDADQYGDVPGTLQAAIVYRATGLLSDARGELKELVSKHPELASLWLFAGDMWMAVGRPDKAEQTWRAAALHEEQEPKLITTAAANRIRELAAKKQPATAKPATARRRPKPGRN